MIKTFPQRIFSFSLICWQSSEKIGMLFNFFLNYFNVFYIFVFLCAFRADVCVRALSFKIARWYRILWTQCAPFSFFFCSFRFGSSLHWTALNTHYLLYPTIIPYFFVSYSFSVLFFITRQCEWKKKYPAQWNRLFSSIFER